MYLDAESALSNDYFLEVVQVYNHVFVRSSPVGPVTWKVDIHCQSYRKRQEKWESCGDAGNT